jgi:hypothetical protein
MLNRFDIHLKNLKLNQKLDCFNIYLKNLKIDRFEIHQSEHHLNLIIINLN